MIVVTAATGSLGQLVVESLLKTVPAGEITVAVRNPDKAAGLAARGVTVRAADYNDAASVRAAFTDADKVLLISGNDAENRAAQHATAVDAAKSAGVGHLVYTSIPYADTTKMVLAPDHKATEEAIRAAGLPFTFLRNGWYTENYTNTIHAAVASGSFAGSATPDARLSSAARADYADAAAAVLTGTGHLGKVYELGGDLAWSYRDLAEELTKAAGKPISYQQVSPARHLEILVGAGLPAGYAAALVDADRGIVDGELLVSTGDLHRLIGRSITPLAETIATILKD
ncbi:MAG TPA: SDR family oxidoreductase [Pseudonocardiaceae bacterium]|jgi:NAD(P)H dehydrogenase (quinone)|nr:SDR family oxidoreductase [Pseudonocardiaceae bacterium]